MPRNVTTGGKAAREVSAVFGLPELKKQVKALQGATVSAEAQSIVGEAARYLSSEIRHGAESVNVPHEVFKNIFSYSKPQTLPSGKAAKVSALAGIRKRGRARPYAVSYAEWKNRFAYTRLRFRSVIPGKRYGQKKAVGAGEVAAGDKVGENLATMWEIGTSKQRAKPFFRPAVERGRSRVVQMIASGYKLLIAKYGGAA